MLGVDRPLDRQVGVQHPALGGADLDGRVTGQVEVDGPGREGGHVGQRRLEVQPRLPGRAHLAQTGRHPDLGRIDHVHKGGEPQQQPEGAGEKSAQGDRPGPDLAPTEHKQTDTDGQEQQGNDQHGESLGLK